MPFLQVPCHSTEVRAAELPGRSECPGSQQSGWGGGASEGGGGGLSWSVPWTNVTKATTKTLAGKWFVALSTYCNDRDQQGCFFVLQNNH